MAIVINGSGTVTGISVGGLPDDIVDAGTLADDAVGLAQMASGTDGNIITYDTNGNPAVVATGSDGQVLTSAGADAVPAFEAAAAGGKVLQVVQGNGFAQWATTSTTWSATNATAAITPSATSSKILVMVSITFAFSTATRPRGGFRLHRDDDTVVAAVSDEGFHVHSLGSGGEYTAHMAFNYLDSPSATTSQDYWIEGRTDSGANTTSIIGHNGSTWINPTTITLIEIGT